MLLIADVMFRNSGLSDLSTMTGDELEQVVQNAQCAFQSVAIPSIDRDRLAAVLLYLVNEHFCQV